MRLSAEVLNLAEQRPNPLGERELVLRGRGIPLIEHLGVTRDAFDSIDFTDNRLTRLDNFPRLERLSTLQLSNNAIETLDEPNLAKNLPNITVVNLSNNRIANLHQIDNMGKAFPKLEFLSLSGNPVTRRQYYRLYTIHHIPSLKVLDLIRISRSERDTAKRLARSAAGAALESDVEKERRTFTPGEGRSAAESFQISFTMEQKEQLRHMVANATSPQEIEQIESYVQKGIFPSHLLAVSPITTTAKETTTTSSTPCDENVTEKTCDDNADAINVANDETKTGKRSNEEDIANDETNSKKART